MCDLDDASTVQYFLLRYETICLRHGVVLDWHVPILEGKLDQCKVIVHQEKTRLWAVGNYANRVRGLDENLVLASKDLT